MNSRRIPLPTLLGRLRLSAARNSESATDEELVDRIQRRDAPAWAAFLDRYTELLYGKAWEYSQSAGNWPGCEARGEEAAELYLFMAESLLRSLYSFKRICKPSTWVYSVIGNRKHVIKAYLLHKDPGRADVRLPKILEARPQIDQEIFRRLIWGLEPVCIAQDLQVPERRCLEIEVQLAEHSPRVHARILANRQARIPEVRLDEGSGEDGPQVQLVHPGPNPEEEAELRELRGIIRETIAAAVQELTKPERRVLILLYNQGATPAQIAELPSLDPEVGLGEAVNVNRCYYLKDSALDRIAAHLARGFGTHSGCSPHPEVRRRQVLKALDGFLREHGVPLVRG